MQIPTQEVADKAPMLSSESRIERLRALFENVGLADLHRSRVPLSDVGQQSARQNENPAPAIKAAAESEAVVSAVSHSTGANIEPAPTSILPRESVPVKEPALEDEIRILPAKRGQYSSR